MNRQRLIAIALVSGGCLVGLLPTAHAISRGTAAAGVAYVSGGVGETEQLALKQERSRYSFWLITASRGSGSYMADVQVRILNARTQQPVLEHTMDGPWLFAALPAGRYDIEASYRQAGQQPVQMQKRTTTIHPGDQHQMVLYFDTND
jgi:hypothetical protein